MICSKKTFTKTKLAGECLIEKKDQTGYDLLELNKGYYIIFM